MSNTITIQHSDGRRVEGVRRVGWGERRIPNAWDKKVEAVYCQYLASLGWSEVRAPRRVDVTGEIQVEGSRQDILNLTGRGHITEMFFNDLGFQQVTLYRLPEDAIGWIYTQTGLAEYDAQEVGKALKRLKVPALIVTKEEAKGGISRNDNVRLSNRIHDLEMALADEKEGVTSLCRRLGERLQGRPQNPTS